MRRHLRPEDLGDLLIQPRTAVLATRRADDTILLSPVWYEWHDGGFTVVTGRTDIKVRHLRRDPRASMVVAEDAPPYRGLEVRGIARLLAGSDLAVLTRIAARYLGPERGAAYAREHTPADLALIRLEPGVLRAWDFADEY